MIVRTIFIALSVSSSSRSLLRVPFGPLYGAVDDPDHLVQAVAGLPLA
jgi:hypothetical protein